MGGSLTLESFVATKDLFLQDPFFAGDPFKMLGKPLTAWLEAFLDKKGVTDRPLVKGKVSSQALLEGAVLVEEGAEIGPFAYVKGPAYIGPRAEVRHGAFIRGSVFVGSKAVVGHTTEVKGAIFFDHAKAGHFAYVGDSILGCHVNLGAGTKLANLKIKGDEVKVRCPQTNTLVPTGLRKLGAILGDRAQTGCNAVLSPGTLLLPDTAVMPCVHFRGTLKEGVIFSAPPAAPQAP